MNDCAGGKFDLRPVSDPKFSVFEHDISVFFDRGVNDLVIQNFHLEWDMQQQSFFTTGIELAEFNNARIFDFTVTAARSKPQFSTVLLHNGKDFHTNLDKSEYKNLSNRN